MTRRGRIVQELASLKQLDGQEVSKKEKLEVGFEISSEEEGDDDSCDDEGGEEETEAGTSPALAAAPEPSPTLGAYKTKLPNVESRWTGSEWSMQSNMYSTAVIYSQSYDS